MTAYYNEFDPFAAKWLRELIKDGLIAPGVVDERSITEVIPSDLDEFTQCHFFAGIGGWSIALRLAGWPDDRPVWTGSPPCQPFSVAGKQTGKSDERHLWPAFFDLIREQAPTTVFGEQVASAIRHGWFDDLQKDLEKQNYASAMAVLPACSVGAPQKRDRLWYVANKLANTDHDRQSTSCGTGQSGEQPEAGNDLGWSGQTSPMANPDVLGRLESVQPLPGELPEWVGSDSVNSESNRLADTKSHGNSGGLRQILGTNEKQQTRKEPGQDEAEQRINGGIISGNISMADPIDAGPQGRLCGRSDTQRENIDGHPRRDGPIGAMANTQSQGGRRGESLEESGHKELGGSDQVQLNAWGDSIGWPCRDGKTRPVPTEPTLFPLADGVSNRVGILRGAGNAIVPQVAAEVIKAFMEFEVNK